MIFQNYTTLYEDVIIVGDFNLDISKKNFLNKINSLASHSNMKQLIKDYTRITEFTKTKLDLAFVSKPDKVSSSGVHSLGLSDHSLIYLIRRNKKIKTPPKIVKSRCFKHFNEHKFIETIKKLYWDHVSNCNDVNNAYSRFNDLFDQACNLHCPLKEKRIKGSLPEWISSDYIKLSKDRDHYYSKAHKTNDPQDWLMAKNLRNQVNILNKKLKKNYCTNAINDNVNNSKKLWGTIRKLIPKNVSTVSKVKTNNGFTSNDEETASQFNDYFTTVGNNLAEHFKKNNDNNNEDSNNGISPNRNVDYVDFQFDVITPDFVFDQICNYSNNKSTGISNTSIKLLKLAAPIICHPLAYICNLSMFTSTFPSDWKKAKVTPVYNSGDKSDVGNYRPISVLPILSKILERTVHDQLYKYLTCNNVLNQCQSGFRSKYSTNTALLDVTDYILQNANEGKVTASIFLDLKKAFDTVNHDLLIKKLNSYGIRGRELDWFKSYLSGRMQAVNINSTLSHFKNIEIGVPQGSILGPLLFIIFVNSLPDSIHNGCKCVMYADDTTLLLNSSDPNTLQNDLNSNLGRIADWFQANKLTLNIKKTKLMLFGSKQSLHKFKDVSLIYNGVSIERVEKFKYLGVTFDPQLSWNDHVNYLSSIISKRIGVIYRVKHYLPNKIINMLAQALVFPHFDYCSSVWSNFSMHHSNELQILQNRLARVLLSADIRTSVDKNVERPRTGLDLLIDGIIIYLSKLLSILRDLHLLICLQLLFLLILFTQNVLVANLITT